MFADWFSSAVFYVHSKVLNTNVLLLSLFLQTIDCRMVVIDVALFFGSVEC